MSTQGEGDRDGSFFLLTPSSQRRNRSCHRGWRPAVTDPRGARCQPRELRGAGVIELVRQSAAEPSRLGQDFPAGRFLQRQ
jgi:hypothetical protein